ncbi:FAD-binding protein [Arthrobacter sp. zg-Y1143]|uniref:FAD-binding protein n=1 Tax=Arthrobacter sp. zg-Y1143 TaxID=3049065 RepID=UPI0024C3750F|nr:FAD-binding protein [Arthrobacter sp. zg-Y1143]MDK1326086.1 FAD-binding protein [Arthrobacter sp. zg-Y1143]
MPDTDTNDDDAAPLTELTGAVVIGCGLSGMAVARELSRQGVDSIVIHGPVADADAIRETSGEPAVFPERVELVRLLQAYAAGHHLDVREDSEAREISLASPADGVLPAPVPAPSAGKWAVRTGRELLLADYVVLTSCSRADLRKLSRAVGAGSGPGAATALRGIGVYLVGVDPLPVGSLIRQARAAGEAIADAAPPA